MLYPVTLDVPPEGPRRRAPYRSALALVLLGAIAPVAHGFRRDELLCEAAVARVEQCDASFSASAVNCTYEPASCSRDSRFPDIPSSRAEEIAAMTCAEIERGEIVAEVLELARDADEYQGDWGEP